jgi:phenylpropionate dioxygenase-like ring-hydroxylating dioxygenase large terminal subunit
MNPMDTLLNEPISDQASDQASTDLSKKDSKLENLRTFWYVACLSDSLQRTPLARTIVDSSLVLFRDPDGRAHALLDRCCHRGLPLSRGAVTSNGLQCGYHGWEFSPGGQCIRIPGLPSDTRPPTRACVPSFAVREQDGLVWVYGSPDQEPPGSPFPIQSSDDPAYSALRIDFGSIEAPVENVIDNFMDSLHPPFVHKGLIYDDAKRNHLEIVMRPYRHPDGHVGVEGCYLGEPVPTQGLIGRLFAKRSTDPMIHEERYIAPTLTQAEYRIGDTSHLLSTHLFTPETATRSRMYLLLRTKSRIPKMLRHPLLRALFTRLFRQDIRILGLQQRALKSSGSLPRISSELDLLSLSTLHFFHQLTEGKSQDQIQIKPQRYKADI